MAAACLPGPLRQNAVQVCDFFAPRDLRWALKTRFFICSFDRPIAAVDRQPSLLHTKFSAKCGALTLLGLLIGADALAAHISISWKDNSSNETNFQIERALADLAFAPIANVSANVTVFTDTTVSPSTGYWYRVRAINGNGASAYSNVIAAVSPAASNTNPTISRIADTIIGENGATGALSFTVGDAESAAGNLILSGSSSNPALIPNAAITFGGGGANRTVTVRPTASRSGLATITVSASDGVLTTTSTFDIVVNTLNTPLTIGPVANQTINEDATTEDLSLAVANAGSDGSSILLRGSSSNPDLLPTTNIVFGGSGTNRTLRLIPAANKSGTATVNVTVSNGSATRSTAFTLTVIAVNDAPILPTLAGQTTPIGIPLGPFSFTVGDAETGAGDLALSATTSNPALIPQSNIEFGGSGANRTLLVTPAAGQLGNATVTLRLTDGIVTSESTFPVTVVNSGTTPPTAPPPEIFPLTITSPPYASGTVGVNFSYTIAATNTPTSFDALNLPPGIAVNKSTGALTGAPQSPGTYLVTLISSNTGGTHVAPLSFQVSPPGTQTVSLFPLREPVIVGQPMRLNATASSGLPITFTVVSGYATISGDTITLHDSDQVVVRATQAGNLHFNGSSAERVIGNGDAQHDLQVYFGFIGAEPFGAILDIQYGTGKFYRDGYMIVSFGGEGFIVPLAINNDGTFVTTLQGASLERNTVDLKSPTSPQNTTPPEKRTFRGRFLQGTLRGTIEELGRTFTAAIQLQDGATQSFAGVYTARTSLSPSDTTNLVVGAQGQVYALSMNSTLAAAASGTISPTGAFSIRTPQSVTIEGNVSLTSRLLTGSVQWPGKPPEPFLGTGVNHTRTDRLSNLSTRVRVGESGGPNVLFSGFALAGDTSKRLLLRAIGPSLRLFGVQDALRDPLLELFDQAGQLIAQSDDWGTAPDIINVGDQVGAFRLTLDSKDSALLPALKSGVYTMQVSSRTGEGVALIEVYDASEDRQAASLVNISTRGTIDSGEGALIGGFVVSGNTLTRVLVRGIGPALETFGVTGVVADPALRIYQGPNLVAQNDNWETPQPVNAVRIAASGLQVSAAAARVGAFGLPAGSKDAAILIVLPPGSYTAEVSGTNGAAGTGLLEIYQLPND